MEKETNTPMDSRVITMRNKLDTCYTRYKAWPASVIAMDEQRRTKYQEKEMIRRYTHTTEQRKKEERPSEDGHTNEGRKDK